MFKEPADTHPLHADVLSGADGVCVPTGIILIYIQGCGICVHMHMCVMSSLHSLLIGHSLSLSLSPDIAWSRELQSTPVRICLVTLLDRDGWILKERMEMGSPLQGDKI